MVDFIDGVDAMQTSQETTCNLHPTYIKNNFLGQLNVTFFHLEETSMFFLG
jgi:hypothetical protein